MDEIHEALRILISVGVKSRWNGWDRLKKARASNARCSVHAKHDPHRKNRLLLVDQIVAKSELELLLW